MVKEYCDRCLKPLKECQGRACLGDFGDWLDQLLKAKPTRDRVRMLLQDAYWQGDLEGSELKRVFLCQRAGIQLIPELSQK